MSAGKQTLKVYYDGACPRCRRDRDRYCAWAGEGGAEVDWVDITGRDEELHAAGIEPQAALTELHVRDGAGAVHRELDAYILLMSRVHRLRPLAWLINLPVIRPCLSWLYRRWVRRRLRRQGRLPEN
jgi:predicted DCC family thiol-disulfide oxidoreductase YuxK